MTQVAFDKLWRNSLIFETDSSEEKKKSAFDFKCTDCKSDKLTARPYCIRALNISYKPDNVDNSDLPNEGVNEENDPLLFNLRDYYNSLPTLKEALLISVNYGNIRLDCVSCKNIFALPENHSKEDLKKFIHKQHPNNIL